MVQMGKVTFSDTSNPNGLIELANALPSEINDDSYAIFFPSGYLYSTAFPVIAAWSKRVPHGIPIQLDASACDESAKRLVSNVGLYDIVEEDLERPSRIIKGKHVPLHPVSVGHSTDKVLDKVYHIVDDWAGYQRDISAFRVILSELAENILVHSESETPGYIHANVHETSHGNKCEITFADTGIGVRNSYIEGSNEDAKQRIESGASALDIAIDGLSSSKPKGVSPGGRSYFGLGLYTAKRLIELNRGIMTLISDDEYATIGQYRSETGTLEDPWPGTIVSLVIDLANSLPLEEVYEEETRRIIPGHILASEPKDELDSTSVGATDRETDSAVGPKEREVKLGETSNKLLSREEALAMRAELATLLVDGSNIVVDFEGVQDITPSFADECFGKLAEKLGEKRFRQRVKFSGGPIVLHRLVDYVIANRMRSDRLE